MNVYVNSIHGIDDAIVTMFLSKRTWTRELEERVRRVCKLVLDENGFMKNQDSLEQKVFEGVDEEFNSYMSKLVKWGTKHITMLRFVDVSCTVEGIHRAGQDDWDAHAMRFNNRIIRSSTRLATFEGNETSDYYKSKIIPDDVAAQISDEIHFPEKITYGGITYVRATNGYIREDLKDNKDVKRGLYMECIPSNFIFKCNITELAHVFKERNKNSGANPEVKELCESLISQIEEKVPFFTREMFEKITQ